MKSLTSIVSVLLCVAASQVGAQLVTIPALGWNHDIVYGGGELGQGISGSMDNGPGFFGANWYGIGRNSSALTTGLPIGPTVSVSTPTDLSFEFQPFAGGPNAVLLNANQSGLLTLTTPMPYFRLALIGSTGNGTANDAIVVNYADGTSETFGGGAINQDWFFNDTNVAFIAQGRTTSNDGFSFDNVNNNQPRLYQEIYTLGNTLSEVVSVGITNNGGGHSAIMAISGEAVPEPTSAFLLIAGSGALGLTRYRRRQVG
ncbi:MAG: hypothetical protein JWL90_3227 [Chthoniobacteraceae bacterium]|nr:hypothetical protein [Chthoniobacteraceae bacterium]